MTVNPRLVGVVAKLDQARKHIDALNEATERFDQAAVKGGGGLDDETGEYVFSLRKILEPDPEIAVITGDVVHNLRSALDHLAFQLVDSPRITPLGVQKRSPTERWFPICINSADYDDSGLIGADPVARAKVKGLQPFHNKTHPLWLINEMSVRDKHRLLLVIIHEITMVGVNEALFETLTTRAPGPFIGGAEIVRGKLRAGVDLFDPHMDMRLHIGFGLKVTAPPSGDTDLVFLVDDMLQCTNGIIGLLSEYVAI
jgi:hypothetical protein